MSERLIFVELRENRPSEEEWLSQVLSKFEIERHSYKKEAPVIPGALYLYNSIDALQLDPEFLNKVAETKGCGLLHVGDEYFRGGYKQYAAFDYVIRAFPIKAVSGPGVFDLALGPTSYLGDENRTLASERTHSAVFAGDWKSDRGAMAKRFAHLPDAFLSVPRSFLGETGVSRDEYFARMAAAKFAPCPAGNICLETCRAYEALHFGAIPLLPKRRFADAYADLFGSHPLPTFGNWNQAAKFVEHYTARPELLDALQAECLQWWDEFRVNLSDELFEFILLGRHGEFASDLKAKFSRNDISPIERFGHILRQQNRDQTLDRLKLTARRSLSVLRGRGKIQGKWTYSTKQEPE